MRATTRWALRAAGLLLAVWVVGCSGGDDAPPPPSSTATTTTTSTPPVPPPPPTYQIALHRPVKVGDVFRETTSVKKHQAQIMKIGGQTKNEIEDRQVELVAKVEVLATDAQGQPTSARYTIERLEAGQTGTPLAPVLAPGQVLTVVRGQQPVLALDQGGALTEAQTDDVKAVISTGPVTPVTDDQAFGTATPQLVGATWPINAQYAAAGLSDDEITVTPDGLMGQTKLVAARPEAGQDCLEVSVSFLVKSPVFTKLPPGSTVTGQMTVDHTGLYPLDGTRQPVTQSGITRGQFNMILLNGAATSDMTMEETKTTSRVPYVGGPATPLLPTPPVAPVPPLAGGGPSWVALQLPQVPGWTLSPPEDTGPATGYIAEYNSSQPPIALTVYVYNNNEGVIRRDPAVLQQEVRESVNGVYSAVQAGRYQAVRELDGGVVRLGRAPNAPLTFVQRLVITAEGTERPSAIYITTHRGFYFKIRVTAFTGAHAEMEAAIAGLLDQLAAVVVE